MGEVSADNNAIKKIFAGEIKPIVWYSAHAKTFYRSTVILPLPIMTKAAIIHGTKGSPQSNWFSWLSVELNRCSIETIVPLMPTPKGQTLASWLRAFNSQVGNLSRDSILIGHSIGAVFALRLLERAKIPVRLAVLVAGLTGKIGIPEYDNLNSTFVADPFDWGTIRKNAGEFICLVGDNDPYVPFEQGKEIATGLGVELIVIPGGGHLNSKTGFTTFPRLLDELSDRGILGKITTARN